MRTETYFDAVTSQEILDLAKLYKATRWYEFLVRGGLANVLAVKITYRAKTKYIREGFDGQ